MHVHLGRAKGCQQPTVFQSHQVDKSRATEKCALRLAAHGKTAEATEIAKTMEYLVDRERVLAKIAKGEVKE